MEIPETKRFIPKGFELGTILSQPNRSITSTALEKRKKKKKKKKMRYCLNYSSTGFLSTEN